MNKYGQIAREHWAKYAPTRYSMLTDPETFFESLGESALVQIDQIAGELERQLPAGLPYLEKVGQMNAIRRQAEETVLRDLVYSIETESANPVEELEMMLGDLPGPDAILEAIARIRETAEEQEPSSTSSLTTQQEAMIARLSDLLPLVSLNEDPDEMSEPEVRDRILALRAYWNPETRSLVVP